MYTYPHDQGLIRYKKKKIITKQYNDNTTLFSVLNIPAKVFIIPTRAYILCSLYITVIVTIKR